MYDCVRSRRSDDLHEMENGSSSLRSYFKAKPYRTVRNGSRKGNGKQQTPLVSRQLSRVIVEVLIVGAAHLDTTWTCPADLKILNISACETRYEISTNDRTNQP